MSKAKNYTIQAPNATAVNVLRSWLTAIGIESRRSRVPEFDLTVICVDDSELEVQVAKRGGKPLPGPGLQVLAGDITGKRLEAALEAFYRVTDAAGYDRVQPVDRGAPPELNAMGNPRKLHYKDEDFLVTIRHTEFRRSPNPSDDRWTKYAYAIKTTCNTFLRTNPELCARNGLTLDDIMTYARCYTVEFCSRYEIPESETTHFDNERKLTQCLKQRLYLDDKSSLRAMLAKKERSTMPDVETVSIGLFGKPHVDTEVSPEVDDDKLDYDYIAKHCELDTSSPSARKASATSKLNELLASLPHDQMIELLRNASVNDSFDFVTRREAARQIRLHAATCDSCESFGVADDAGVEENEDGTGASTFSAEE